MSFRGNSIRGNAVERSGANSATNLGAIAGSLSSHWIRRICNYAQSRSWNRDIEPRQRGAGLKPALLKIGEDGAGFKPAPTDTNHHGLPEIIRAFKTFSSRRINEFREMTGVPAWQRNYFEHVIRNENALDAIREYIKANPSQWHEDPENPDLIG